MSVYSDYRNRLNNITQLVISESQLAPGNIVNAKWGEITEKNFDYWEQNRNLIGKGIAAANSNGSSTASSTSKNGIVEEIKANWQLVLLGVLALILLLKRL